MRVMGRLGYMAQSKFSHKILSLGDVARVPVAVELLVSHSVAYSLIKSRARLLYYYPR
jgi:hypothetical protein